MASLASSKSWCCRWSPGLWSSLQNHLPSSGLCKFGINLISLLLLLTESERMKIKACWEGQADSLSHSPVNFHLSFSLSSGMRGVKAGNL